MTLEYAPGGLIGCLTPQANTTVEPELGILLPSGIGFLNARLTSPKTTIRERLVDYFDQLDQSLTQFGNAPLDAIAVACTGASYLAGREREAAMVSACSGAAGVPVVTAAMAVVESLQTIGARQIDFVSCYPPDLTRDSCSYWESQGFEIGQIAAVNGDSASFHPIYSMQTGDASDALDKLLRRQQDAILMLGTGMPTLRSIAEVSAIGETPVLSCMLCLAWQCVMRIKNNRPTKESLLSWSRGTGWAGRLDRHSMAPHPDG